MTISGKSKNLHELNKKLKVSRYNDYMFNQINKITINVYSHLGYINISFYLKFRIPICLRQIFREISQNPDYLNNFCNDVANHFHFAIRKWFNQLK